MQKKLVDQVYTRADLEFIFMPPTQWNNGKARHGEINLDTVVAEGKKSGNISNNPKIVTLLFVSAVDGIAGPLGRGMQNGNICFVNFGAPDKMTDPHQRAFVIAHELGHCLGLHHAVDDPNVPNDIPNIQGDGPYDKRLAVEALHPSQVKTILSSPLVQQRSLAESSVKTNQSINSDAITSTFSQKLADMLESDEPVALEKIKPLLKEYKCANINTLNSSLKPESARKIYQRCRDGVVIIGKIYKCSKCDKWHTSLASGFIIRKDGIIVTNYHVLDNDKKGRAIAVQLRDGRMFAIQDILASSKKEDLAIIKIDADNLTTLPIAKETQIGAPLYCISHPVKQFYTMTEGILAGDFMHKGNRREFAVTCDYAKGSSGAPILDETGAVAAIVRVTQPVYYEKNHGVPTKIQMVWKYCIPSSTLLDLLRGF